MRFLPLVCLLAACSGPSSDPTDSEAEPDPRFDRANWPATVGGERPAAVNVPATDDGETLLPLVILLHGYGVNGAVQDLYFGMSKRVDAEGFVLITPDGTLNADGSRFWNATPACCDFEETGVDDVGYLGGLIDEIEAVVPIDPDRIAFAGHSNGGFMSYRMACERSDRVSSIATLAGSTWLDDADCGDGGPVNVLHVHGDADSTISYAGDSGYPGAEETVGRWADRAGCDGTTEAAGPFDYDGQIDGAETAITRYTTGCTKDVDLWRLAGSEHAPFMNDTFRDDFLGWILEKNR